VLVSDRRLACRIEPYGWVSLDFAGVARVVPDLENWAVVLEFQSDVPLRLSGPSAPGIAVWSVFATRGPDGLRADPGLQRLGAI